MQTILVPTDFSVNAATALRYAIRLCNITGADLQVFHCSQPPLYAHAINETEAQRNKLIEDDAAIKLKKLTSRVKQAYRKVGLPMGGGTKVQVEFSPFVVEKTLEVAKKSRVSLIVMGTHGASGISKFLFGSNTSNMIAKAAIPVLAIPSGFRFRKNIETILFAADLVNFREELKEVTEFATAVNAGINVLHLATGTGAMEAIDDMNAVIKKNGYPKITVAAEVLAAPGAMAAQLRRYIKTHRPSCLVMFTKERSFWESIFKVSKTEDMVSALPLPLLSFRKQTLS